MRWLAGRSWGCSGACTAEVPPSGGCPAPRLCNALVSLDWHGSRRAQGGQQRGSAACTRAELPAATGGLSSLISRQSGGSADGVTAKAVIRWRASAPTVRQHYRPPPALAALQHDTDAPASAPAAPSLATTSRTSSLAAATSCSPPSISNLAHQSSSPPCINILMCADPLLVRLPTCVAAAA